MVTQERIKERFRYDPELGRLITIVALRGSGINRIAGCLDKAFGYRRVRVDGVNYFEHHLVWLYHNGSMPQTSIDHIDGDRANNRIANLRLATQKQNTSNRRISKNNKSGYKGVSWSKNRKKWCAGIQHYGISYNLGSYDNILDAARAYNKRAVELWGEFAKLNEIPESTPL